VIDVRVAQHDGVDAAHGKRHAVQLLVEARALNLAAIEQNRSVADSQ
jgi:hypothetical protein